jgi:uncharacterized protein with FMN-binding domain
MWRSTQKIVLSLSLIVLFALYAMQRQAQPSTAALIAAVQPPMTATVGNVSASATATAIATAANTAIAARAASDGELARIDQAPTDTAVPPTATDVRPTETATTAGAFKDGTYDGGGADAHWGTVEVQAVITNGRISDVVFVQYPNHRNRSQEINSRAMPELTQEAIQAQDSNVDLVSGATDTSEAFIQSLANALSQAAT